MKWDDEDTLSLLQDMVLAENTNMPGPAKHYWVIAEQLARHKASPTIPWAWVIFEVLTIIIPKLLDWLKKKYGQQWPDQITPALMEKKLPWQ